MSLNNLPSKVEVMGWSPQSLADYMKKLKLSGCDKVVKKSSITGAQFMKMTECDLQVFPSLYISIITKIQRDISKGEQKRPFGLKPRAQKYPKQVFVQEEEVWNSDEFDNDSDYEGPQDEEEGEDSYICAVTEPQTDEQHDSDEASEEDNGPPSSADAMKPPCPPRGAHLQDGHHRGPVPDPPPAERSSKPPHPVQPRMNHALPRPYKAPGEESNKQSHSPSARAPASPPNLPVDRSRKPAPPGPPQKDLTKSKGSAVKAPGSSGSKVPQPKPPRPRNVFNRLSKHSPAPPVPTQPAVANDLTPGPTEGLDPSWYAGNMTRHQAEAALREVDQDGAFVVRDSSKGSGEHPYTLMLLKQGKVYNIKIRNHSNSYSLGTGLNTTKSFPGVKEMITHHTHTPLLLIDATDRSSEAPSQCCLLHPAGL